MKWSEMPFHPTAKVLRQFAGGWLVFFSALGAYQWLGKGRPEFGLAVCSVALGIGFLGLLKPPALRWLFVSWMVLAFPIGWLISQLMLLILFYAFITPLAVFFRWRGRDLLSRKPAPGRESFWIDKTTPANARSYFNQY